MVNALVVLLTLSCAVLGLACASSQDLICLLLESQPRWHRLRRRHAALRSFWRLYAVGMVALALVQALILILPRIL